MGDNHTCPHCGKGIVLNVLITAGGDRTETLLAWLRTPTSKGRGARQVYARLRSAGQSS